MSQEPCAVDDPRISGFPCFSQHQCKVRTNQHATWEVCQKCGLRMKYTGKKGYSGEHRSMGPDPRMMTVVLEELQKEFEPALVNEKIVTGRLMEMQGRALQAGLTNRAAYNMTLTEYRKRLGIQVEKVKSPSAKPKAKFPPSMTEMDKEVVKEDAKSQLYEAMRTSLASQPASSEAKEILERAICSVSPSKVKVKQEKIEDSKMPQMVPVEISSDEAEPWKKVDSKQG